MQLLAAREEKDSMGLDLTLTAIPGEKSFLFEKARTNVDYAKDFDKINAVDELRLHLQMILAAPDGTPPAILEELITDAVDLKQWFEEKGYDSIEFHSYTRGYDTINYLLFSFFQELNPKQKDFPKEIANILYEGQDLFSDKSQNWHTRFQYWTFDQLQEFAHQLEGVEFKQLMRYYNYEKLSKVVYNATWPEQLEALREEFETLKAFYKKALPMQAYILIKVD